ncbi:MAG TPA: zf-HC2 domain-containing protein [Chthonomonadaceae bacterium]|nr:zf-HC2 domain-containing protein [Chthonomonadaceae bacterium]
MYHTDTNDNRECAQMRLLLSDYLDDTLSARQVWNVEKHLAACAECAALCRRMQATVRLLQAAPRFDTSDNFMAKLHARLDSVEPERPLSRSRLTALRDGWAALVETLRQRPAPALSLGFALTALVALLLLPHGGAVKPSDLPLPPSRPTSAPVPIAAESLRRSVALAAANPLDDPAAANLEAHAALEDAAAVNTDAAPN